MHRASGAGLTQLCPWKARKPVAADLQLIYRAAGTAAEAEQQLAQLEGKWKPIPA
jgi:transposase-like protein